MAKSKLAQVNEKIADKVTEGFQKIEDGVVTGYQKIEGGVVDGFNKVVDGFVGQFLTREGETAAEARTRLAQEQADREAAMKAAQDKRAEEQRQRIEAAQKLGNASIPTIHTDRK